jgi:hypothetical protein
MLTDYEKYLIKRYTNLKRNNDTQGSFELKMLCKDQGMRDVVKQMNQIDDQTSNYEL